MATTFGQLILAARRHLNEIYVLVTPGAPLVAPQGVVGVTTYTYKVVARNSTGTSEAGQATSTATGNAALSVSNYNQLTWTAVPYADTYDIYRTVGGATTGKIVSATAATTANDTGLAGDSATAPTINTSGTLNAVWVDAELLEIGIRGVKDMWRAILDLHQGHFSTIDETNVSLAASTSTLTGVPADTFRILLIEPRDTTESGSSRDIVFVPRKYNSPEFIAARTLDNVDPSNGNIIFYDVMNVGTPVATPSVVVAPKLTSAMNLRFVYAPTLTAITATTDNNPIPGESDHGIIAWIVAFAAAKESGRVPDANWLAVYATEKQSLLTGLTPRQEQEPKYVEGMFEGDW